MRRKALGRSLPKRGKDKREPRSDAFARRQSEYQRLLALSYEFIRHQGIRNGLRHICGMQNECTWKTCGVIDWWVFITESVSIESNL